MRRHQSPPILRFFDTCSVSHTSSDQPQPQQRAVRRVRATSLLAAQPADAVPTELIPCVPAAAPDGAGQTFILQEHLGALALATPCNAP